MAKATFSDIIGGDRPVLIDFYADWCGPCKSLSPIIQEVAREMGDKVRVIKIDVDKNQAIAHKYQVRGIPTMMIFKEGKSVWRQSGVLPKEQIVHALSEHT